MPSQSRLPPCQLSRRESQVSPPPLGEVSCQRHDGEGLPPAPAHIRVPRRRLCQRAAHAWGGVTGELGENLRGIEDAIKKPPARVSYGKQSTGLFSYFPALADATKTLGALPPIPPPPLKRWTKLLPACGAHVRWPLDEHERQRAAIGATCLGCNPRELRAQALGKLYVGSPFSCSVNLRGQPTGCPRFFYAAPSNRAPG